MKILLDSEAKMLPHCNGTSDKPNQLVLFLFCFLNSTTLLGCISLLCVSENSASSVICCLSGYCFLRHPILAGRGESLARSLQVLTFFFFFFFLFNLCSSGLLMVTSGMGCEPINISAEPPFMAIWWSVVFLTSEQAAFLSFFFFLTFSTLSCIV